MARRAWLCEKVQESKFERDMMVLLMSYWLAFSREDSLLGPTILISALWPGIAPSFFLLVLAKEDLGGQTAVERAHPVL